MSNYSARIAQAASRDPQPASPQPASPQPASRDPQPAPRPPIPLLVLFGAFLVAIAYIVGASLVRRDAPVFAASPLERVRAANWERVGDTLTIDASDGDRWQYGSLARGRVLTPPETAGWDIAVQRYRVITPTDGGIADLGVTSFAGARVNESSRFVPTTGVEQLQNDANNHWYRYNLLTHLLEPNGHVFAVRTPASTLWKLAVVSYYCPKLEAGCLTVRYAPMPAVPDGASANSARDSR